MSSLRKIMPYVKPHWKAALIAPLLMMLEVAMDLAQPQFLKTIVDLGIAQMRMDVVLRSGLLMLGVAVVGVLGGVGCTVFATRASQRVGADLRGSLFRKVQTFSFGNLDKLETGRLTTRLTNDVIQIQEMIMIFLRIMIRAPFMLIGSLIMAVVTSPRLGLILVVIVPFLGLILVVVIKKAHLLFYEVQRRLDMVNTVMQENLAGVRVVKAFVREDYEKQRFGKANEAFMVSTMAAMRFIAIVMPFNMLILNLGIVAVVWMGGIQVIKGTITIGAILAFVNYLLRVLMSLMMVGMLLVRISRAMASADRIQEVLESEPRIRNRVHTIPLCAPKGYIVFDDVTFGYDSISSDPVLQHVSFTAEPGETVALLGATGSGKTTLILLIPRFYDVIGGRITFDGIDLRDLDKQDLRREIGVALQESVLFSGTVGDNIRYARPSATDQEVVKAARAAQAHSFIIEMPDGYDTMVGQRGVNLSGGQKQRIAIARAILSRPRVLLLDDCTSAVDVETEARIQDGLTELMHEATTFVVAQRLSTVLAADKILVLDDGRIAAQGTHSELMRASSIYREIYESQLGKGATSHV